jgi:hypothetical protein
MYRIIFHSKKPIVLDDISKFATVGKIYMKRIFKIKNLHRRVPRRHRHSGVEQWLRPTR